MYEVKHLSGGARHAALFSGELFLFLVLFTMVFSRLLFFSFFHFFFGKQKAGHLIFLRTLPVTVFF